jgi:2Fe-2S ferredoxin
MDMPDKRDIIFYVQYRGSKREVKTYRHEYRNLMALLYDKFYFENFGECKGIGRCGTCHIKVDYAASDLTNRIGNEHVTLAKMENVETTSRLSCHILVTEAIHNACFTIADEGNLGLY